jgi:hypothetical protein
MITDATLPCANCQRLQAELDALQAKFHALQAQFDALQATVAQLQKQLAAARKDSSNSSKPPSSDIVKPPKPPPPPGQERRQPGGQPEHAPHRRVLFPPEMLTSPPTDYLLNACPACGGHLSLIDDSKPLVVQQVDPGAPGPSPWKFMSTAVMRGGALTARRNITPHSRR